MHFCDTFMGIYLNIGHTDFTANVRMLKFGSELRYGIRSPNVRTPVDIPNVNKRNDIREPNIVLCLAVELLSHGPSKTKYQAGSVIKPHCCLTSRNQLVLTACACPFKPGTAGLIPGSLSLSDDTIN